jgi:protein-disulfide isomerase
MLLRRSILVLILLCLGCSAQSPPSEVSQRVERHVRKYYSIPSSVKIDISPLRPSEFPNYDALTITLDGEDKKQHYEFLLSRDGNSLIRLTKLDLSKDPYAEVMKQIDTKGRPTRGNKDAKVVAVNYDDFQCPFCSRLHETLFPQLLKEYGDRVVFIYKDFPLSEIHPWATHAAADGNCLAAQNNEAYWDFADYIHANQREVNQKASHQEQFAALDKMTLLQAQKHSVDVAKLQACMKAQNEDAIKASIKEGGLLGVTATPTLFVNGQELDGAVPISEIRAAFDEALKNAGVPVPVHPAEPAGAPAPSK